MEVRMTTVTIESVNEWGVKPEGAGWADYSKNYEGPHPLVAGQTYEVDIALWTSKDGTKEKWYINKAKPAGETHAPPPAPTALPPVVDAKFPHGGIYAGNTIAGDDAAPTFAKDVDPTLPPARDETRVSIERQVCLKAAVEAAIANLRTNVEADGAVAAGSLNPHDIVGDAAVFYAWVSGASLVEQAVAAGDGAIATRPEDDSRYGDPGPRQ